MTAITESQWLQHHRFQFFPFDRPEAGNEKFSSPEFLAACFVEPESFAAVRGQADSPVTTLLFAARGTGKTACRVMLDYYCRSGSIPHGGDLDGAYVLSVPHLYSYLLFDQSRALGWSKAALLEAHAQEIMNRAMPAFAELLAVSRELQDVVKALPIDTRQEFAWFIGQYAAYLSKFQAKFLFELGFDLSGDKSPTGFSGALQKRQEMRVDKQPLWLDQLQHARMKALPLNHLEQWTDLLHDMGILAVYILVDGVDEFMDAAAEPKIAFQTVRPLLASLRLMDSTPHLALKFFLPDSIEPLIRRDRAIRHDRGFGYEYIRWRDEDLVEILHRRLSASRLPKRQDKDRLLVGFDSLCVPELYGRIEEMLVQEAKGNPRHLLILAGLMVRAHFGRDLPEADDPFLLDKQDWKRALAQYHERIIKWDRLQQAAQSQALMLIEQGEHERLEFKASLRWDIRRNEVNKKLSYVIAKTLAAFMNSDGGHLLIGVGDDGRILGVEKDIQSLNKKNLDGFRLTLSQLVEKYLGAERAGNLTVTFEMVEGKSVCLIEVRPSPLPVYVKLDGRHEFWIRSGNGNRDLDAKAAHEYIQNNINK